MKAITPNPPKWSMGKEKRMKLDKEKVQTPSPLDYHPNPSSVKMNAPGFSIPSARKPYEGTEVPPPGHYHPEKSKNNDFKYSFPYETRESKVDPDNGPAKYSPNYDSVLPVASKQSIGHADRFEDDFYNEFDIGPATYEVNDEWKKSAPSYSFPKQEQRAPVESHTSPGPAEYDHHDEFDVNKLKDKGWSLSGKNLIEKTEFDTTPAPSHYTPQLPQDHVPGGDIGKSEKHPLEKEKVQVPAPNLYQPYVDLVKEHHPNFSFGFERRSPPRKDKGGHETIYDVRISAGSKIK